MAGPKLVDMWRRSSASSKIGQPQAENDGKRPRSFATAASKRPSIAQSASSVQDKLITSFRLGRSRTGSVDSGNEPASNSLVNIFFSLPNELHALILLELELTDIFAFRLISRAFNYLVTSCQSAIVRHYTRNILSPLQKHLYPPPPPGRAELRYVLDMCHRIRSADKLATVLCNFVSYEILRHNTTRKHQRFAKVRDRMHDRMEPLLLILTHFFEQYRGVILERCLASSQSGGSFQIYQGSAQLDDQLHVMTKYDPAQLLDCYRMYGFMLQTLERKLRPPSYATAFERVVRGWTAKPASSHETGILLMLGGVDQAQQILSCKTYSERRKALDLFIKGLSPSETTRWKDNWATLGVKTPDVALERIPTARIGVPPLNQIWVPDALKALLGKEAIEDVEFDVSTSANSTRRFLSDLAGYDILRHPAPEEDENDDADEEGSPGDSSEEGPDEED